MAVDPFGINKTAFLFHFIGFSYSLTRQAHTGSCAAEEKCTKSSIACIQAQPNTYDKLLIGNLPHRPLPFRCATFLSKPPNGSMNRNNKLLLPKQTATIATLIWLGSTAIDWEFQNFHYTRQPPKLRKKVIKTLKI